MRKTIAKLGSGNVFAHLGLPNPEQELLKARLTLHNPGAVVLHWSVPDFAKFIIGPAKGRTQWLNPADLL